MTILRAPGDISVASARKSTTIDISATDHTLTVASRGIWVGGAGNLKVQMVGDGSTPTYVGVAAGTLLPLAVEKVIRTGTTATSLVALY